MQRWQIIDLGAHKINKVVEVESHEDLLAECSKHLMSKVIDITFNLEEPPTAGTVWVGVVRAVGKLKRLKPDVVIQTAGAS